MTLLPQRRLTIVMQVLLRFLSRVGLEVETASDGEECVSKVFSNRSSYYALILVCDSSAIWANA